MSDRWNYRTLDPLVHSPIRLAVLSLLATTDEAEFTWLRDTVGTTDGNLSTHLTRLLDAGFLVADRSTGITRYRLTPDGRAGFERHVEQLERLLRPALEPDPRSP